MPTMLLPEIARSSLLPLDEAAGHDGAAISGEDLRELAGAAQFIVLQVLAPLWKQQYSRLDHGVSGRVLLKSVKAFLESVRTIQRILTRIDALAKEKGQEVQDVKDSVVETSKGAERLGKEAESIGNWLSAPPPKIDPASLPSCGPGPTSDGYVDLDDILVRIGQGQDI